MPEATPIRVLLVETHAFTRDGLRAALNLEPEVHVVVEVTSGEEALESLTWHTVDVVVLPLALPGMDGVQTALELRARWPAVRLVMCTARDLREEVFAALATGADAYWLNSIHTAPLLLAVRLVAGGKMYLDPPVAEQVVRGVRQSVSAFRLTPEERDLLQLLAEGQTPREIALILSVSEDRVTELLRGTLRNLQTAEVTQHAVEDFRPRL